MDLGLAGTRRHQLATCLDLDCRRHSRRDGNDRRLMGGGLGARRSVAILAARQPDHRSAVRSLRRRAPLLFYAHGHPQRIDPDLGV